MVDTFLSIALLLLSIGFIVVYKTYEYLPVREIKRRAQKHDQLAGKLYHAVAYGSSLRELLWLCIVLCSGTGFVLLSRVLPVGLSFLAVIVILWIAFAWLPTSRVTRVGLSITSIATPALSWVLSYLFPVLNRAAEAIDRRRSGSKHTGLFEQSDLLELIEQQQKQSDNRLSLDELAAVKRALLFNDRSVADNLIPGKDIKTVLADDVIGPVLINELHEHNQDFVLVRESPDGQIIGTLAFKRLDLKASGRVRDVMDPTVYYVHEYDSLGDVLHAFFTTQSPLFVVVNNDRECIGIISIQRALHELLGFMPSSDFDQYSDITAVASRYASREKTKATEAVDMVHNTEEVVE